MIHNEKHSIDTHACKGVGIYILEKVLLSPIYQS